MALDQECLPLATTSFEFDITLPQWLPESLIGPEDCFIEYGLQSCICDTKKERKYVNQYLTVCREIPNNHPLHATQVSLPRTIIVL